MKRPDLSGNKQEDTPAQEQPGGSTHTPETLGSVEATNESIELPGTLGGQDGGGTKAPIKVGPGGPPTRPPDGSATETQGH